jgi:hypothetical protein
MKPLATYSFLSWLRHGLANNITNSDSDPGVLIRASIPIDLSIRSTNVDKTTAVQTFTNTVHVYGPGDIIGVEDKAIFKVEPRHWITNFEPNYFPYVEFYDEDFAWRYTPAAPQGNRLRPWLTLVVLEDKKEFTDGKMSPDQPLPFFTLKPGVKALDVFPAYDQLWAWAHVHVNGNIGSTDGAQILKNLDEALREDRDACYCRLICPRHLEPDKAYYAFLVPTFETGRLSGLHQDIPAGTRANQSAWDGPQMDFPYYYRWYFNTGSKGDFEYLVNLLQPKIADKRVGTRDMDVIHPGSGLPPVGTPASLGGLLKLGGALRIPEKFQDPAMRAYDHWDEDPSYPHPFEVAMARLVNLADDYAALEPSDANPDGDPDPVITAPLYGRWPALTNRLYEARDRSLLPNNKNWIHQLNMDPRFRVPAGFGTGVIQKNQEAYMQHCWEQLGDVLAINHLIRHGQLSREVSNFFYLKNIVPLSIDKQTLFTAPVQKKILSGTQTVFSQVKDSPVSHALTTAAFRSVVRPRGALLKRLSVGQPGTTLVKADIINGLNNGALIIAPPKTAPASAITLSGVLDQTLPKNMPPFVRDLLRKYPWIRFIPLGLAILLLLIFLLTGFMASALLISAIGICSVLYYQLSKWSKALDAVDRTGEDHQTPGSVDQMKQSPDFAIAVPGVPVSFSYGVTDSPELIAFKKGMKDAYAFIAERFAEPVNKPLDLQKVRTDIMVALNPATTIPKRIYSQIFLPARILDAMTGDFAPVMTYPRIDIPMYAPLSEISKELFLPNINLIENNSISLLECNEKFIEAYMTGLNHEMARELLWREFPTDQMGSYFRQFWDPSCSYPGNPVPDNIKELLRDITPLHTWQKASPLGDHNNRLKPGDEPPVVLVIRGELLKKYPTAVIYAQKSVWSENSRKNPDASISRSLETLSDDEELKPPKDKVRTPMFEAKMDPDIYFFGFDLTATEVRGGDTVDQDPGWFFVIKERPGEPRYGLDEVDGGVPPKLNNWNNLSWKNTGTAPGTCLQINQTFSLTKVPKGPNDETNNHEEDVNAHWDGNTDAAQLAYILYQVPMMVAVHASRMLPDSTE